MSVNNAALPHGTFPNRIPNLVGLFDRLVVKPVKRWRHRNEAIEALAAMDDRLLADIGIARGEITRVVDELLDQDAQPPPSAIKNRRGVEHPPPLLRNIAPNPVYRRCPKSFGVGTGNLGNT